MRRLFLLGALAAAAACGDLATPSLESLTVYPLLDSLFVGDNAPARTIVYRNRQGQPATPPGVIWTSSKPGVVQVDQSSGAITAVAPGFSVITAAGGNVSGSALVVVSRTFDVQLLLDTIYLMKGDSFPVPTQVIKQGGGAPAPRFGPSVNPSVYDIDSLTGVVRANATGTSRFTVHAATLTDTVADTGFVEVLDPADTSEGKAFFAVNGTVIGGVNGAARGLDYPRIGGSPIFRLRAFVNGSNGLTATAVVIVLALPVTDTGSFTIDSLSPTEAYTPGYDPICNPPRAWGIWSSRVVGVDALSRPGGTIAITSYKAVAGGYAIGGHFDFPAQRVDFYTDPNGILPVRGTFVAPLISSGTCP